MRRFTRGGYRELAHPTSIVVRDEIVGQFVPTAPVPSDPSAAPVLPSAAPEKGSRGGSDAAYRKYARSLR